MSSIEITNRIVKGVISRALDKEVVNVLMEPDVDRIISLLIMNKLSILQETFRIEEFTTPVVKQDENDPTVLVATFSYVPSRDFDWNKPVEWVNMEYKISALGTKLVEEVDKANK